MGKKLILNQARYIGSNKSNTTIPISLPCNKDIIVDDNFSNVVNQYSVYLNEREKCSKIRLTASINLIASNIIFNSVTEIVKDEGSDGCRFLNYEPRSIQSTFGSPDMKNYLWGNDITYCVMDTQISSDKFDDKNYRYLCGFDIFNNHILRSKSMFASYNLSGTTVNYSFNTLDEALSDSNHIFKSVKSKRDFAMREPYNRYRYTDNTVYSFFDCINLKLNDKNGWLGFYNKTQMSDMTTGTDRVINNECPNKFIDLFPGRDRYALKPHYNKSRDRIEKNWEYCITYPCSATTEHVPFINKELDTLKILSIDENVQSDDGVYKCVIYSMSKHGLNVGDMINLYRSKEDDSESEIVEGNLEVSDVFDDYTFSVYTSDWVCTKWVSVFDEEQMDEYNASLVDGNKFTVIYDNKTYIEYSSSDYLNLDYDTDGHIGSKNLSFAKVSNNIQCKYYIRIFSRFPNFDEYEKEITYENIYGEEDDGNGHMIPPVEKYASIEYEKSSTFTKLAYSKNIFGDDIFQVVYNDDIDLSVLRDNLGRPLTSLYLSFFKTNHGYRKWYYKDNGNLPDYKDEEVEWSRCFGKLNCGFEYSPYMSSLSESTLIDEKSYGNIHIMNNVYNNYINGTTLKTNFGIAQDWLGGGNGDDYDEIDYRKQRKFCGDLCVYSPDECIETVIQPCLHRFNTMQRELKGKNYVESAFTNVEITEIGTGSKVHTIRYDYDKNPTSQPEGNIYISNYEIPIRSFSDDIIEFKPNFISIASIEETETPYEYNITTTLPNYFDMNSNICLYDSTDKVVYKCELMNVFDVNLIKVKIFGLDSINNYVLSYRLFKNEDIIPDYAEIIYEPDLAYKWRDLIQNGFEETEGAMPEYPFVNGCLYVHRDVNIFLKRQDPFGDYGLSSQSAYFGIPILAGIKNPIEEGSAINANDAFNEFDAKC